MKSDALLDYQRFEWPSGGSTAVLPVREPAHLDVTSSTTTSLMLLSPKKWGVEMGMGVEGMVPATRRKPKDYPKWSISVENLGTSGKEITSDNLLSAKDKSIECQIQGIEWWNTAPWNEFRSVQITRPAP